MTGLILKCKEGSEVAIEGDELVIKVESIGRNTVTLSFKGGLKVDRLTPETGDHVPKNRHSSHK